MEREFVRLKVEEAGHLNIATKSKYLKDSYSNLVDSLPKLWMKIKEFLLNHKKTPILSITL
ncbi:hypothetical protein DTO10_16010 [Peribacillus butanolivorans]|uniref:Integrase n=1 Tax=Peribacillus butanolivorans TaxID=421767 RepID=A0ABN5N921_9BACI|nr:hypothetical protein DTO10_16010 [Peribacillus butanolivorans]